MNWSVHTAEKLLKATEIENGNIVPAPATASQRRCGMSKELAIIHYKATMAVFKKWVVEGIICEDELLKMVTIIAKKYGLSSFSIYR
ncbi:SHOCT domain-containing protein [Phosphitispora sp. TUW77]|uniref:SHOCT domain-containing protein n=1 Tax=Phosphitispora sp. TUW77 TaxID=3152361 RepID=UPI003AB8C6A7